MSSQATATAEPRAQLGSFPPVASGSSGASAPQRQRPVLSSLSTDSASLAPTASTFSLASSFANAGFTESPAVHSAHHTFTPHADLPFPSSNANFGIKPKSMGDHSSSTAASARLFRQLEVIKTLQSDIAKQHAKLEGVAGGSGANDWVWAVKGTKGVEVAEEGKAAGDAADAEGKGAAGAAGAKATTAKAYDAMVAEFSDRQAGVSEIMSTLSTLSAALKTFHALPSPVLFPPTTPPMHSNTRTAKQSGGGRAETAPADAEAFVARPGRERRMSFEGLR